MTDRRILFRSTAWDAVPALCGAAHVALLIGTFVCFPWLPWWALALAFAAVVFCTCWNVQSISHNFIHNPFFASEWINRAFSVLESIAIGVPQTIYYHYHLNHHFGENDVPGPDGMTKDWGSTYRHGSNGQPEPFWSYCLIGFFRFELGPCFRMIGRYGRRHILLVTAESLALAAFWVGMLVGNWRAFLCFYLPSYYAGWALTYAHTYLLHYHVKPGNAYANSVCSYHRLYNLVFFRNGYHQEHHWAPKVHWTRMDGVRAEILPEMIANGTRVWRGPHITGVIEEWLRARAAKQTVRREVKDAVDKETGRAA